VLKVVPFSSGYPEVTPELPSVSGAAKIINGGAGDFFLAISVRLNGTGTVGDFLSTLYWYIVTTI
jgi:hypothetical protein